jgi:hypothetical protein
MCRLQVSRCDIGERPNSIPQTRIDLQRPKTPHLSVAEQGFFGIAGSAGLAITPSSLPELTTIKNHPNQAAVDRI